MGMLTKAEIKIELRGNLANRTDLDSRLDIILDMAQTRIARVHDFDELHILRTSDALTLDDKFFTLPTNDEIRQMYSIRVISGDGRSRKLIKVLPRSWDKKIPEPEFFSTGYPSHYTMWEGNKIEVWKVPDSAYDLHLRYSKWPTRISTLNDSGTLDFNRMDDIVIVLATSLMLHSLGRREKAKEAFGVYSGMLREAIGEEDSDFDLAMAGEGEDAISASTGVNDPFVRSIR